MRNDAKYVRWIGAVAGLMLLILAPSTGRLASAQTSDSLYVGDAGDSTVKRFDAATGGFLGAFVSAAGNILRGPRGLVFDAAGDLLVANQNGDESTRDEILQYSPLGKLLRRVVARNDKNAPAAPRGIVLWKDFLYVAEFSTEFREGKRVTPGRLLKYTTDGTFVAAFTPPFGSLEIGSEFHPRGVVVGPDGILYVSSFSNLGTGRGGHVLRFDPDTDQFDPQAFISSSGGDGCDCVNDLNRPEGVVFGPAPDFKLYVTSFQGSPGDTDKIMVFLGPPKIVDFGAGSYVARIELDEGGFHPRAFAQALLFGPDGFLFVPITGNGPDTGSVRRYDVAANISPTPFTVFVPPRKPRGPLSAPWYLTFGKTDPGTLAYPVAGPAPGPNREICICADNTLINICATVDCASGPAQDAICGPACVAHGGEGGTGCVAADPGCAGL